MSQKVEPRLINPDLLAWQRIEAGQKDVLVKSAIMANNEKDYFNSMFALGGKFAKRKRRKK